MLRVDLFCIIDRPPPSVSFVLLVLLYRFFPKVMGLRQTPLTTGVSPFFLFIISTGSVAFYLLDYSIVLFSVFLFLRSEWSIDVFISY